MKTSQAIEELRDLLFFDDSVVVDIVEILEEIAAEYHQLGYEDGLIDAGHYNTVSFCSYGKKEDYDV